MYKNVNLRYAAITVKFCWRKSKFSYLCHPKKEVNKKIKIFGSVVQLVRMLPCHLATGETGSEKFFKMYYVYILESLADGDFYKGYTSDYLKRLEEHNSGKSQFTRTKMPWRLIFVQEFANKQEALVQEKKLKRANKEYLKWLITQPVNILNK